MSAADRPGPGRLNCIARPTYRRATRCGKMLPIFCPARLARLAVVKPSSSVHSPRTLLVLRNSRRARQSALIVLPRSAQEALSARRSGRRRPPGTPRSPENMTTSRSTVDSSTPRRPPSPPVVLLAAAGIHLRRCLRGRSGWAGRAGRLGWRRWRAGPGGGWCCWTSGIGSRLRPADVCVCVCVCTDVCVQRAAACRSCEAILLAL